MSDTRMRAESSPKKQPNILWITTHDINPDLGCYARVWPGAEYAFTPNLDRFAADGVRYDNAFAAAPICAPSRSAIITGCFPTAIGTMHMRSKAVPPPEVRLLPEYFRRAGYYCTNNVFTDFQVETPQTAFDDCSATAHWRNRPTADTPFFASFHGMVTHESQIYLDDERFGAATSHVPDERRHDSRAAPLPPYYPDTDVFRTAWARYSDLITEMDHWVGSILAQLEEDGLAQDTIVVFWSDHGKGMPRAKRWPNEAGLHEPLIIRWPGKLAEGASNQDLVHTMDLAPTMLAMAGLEIPQHMHGRPFIDGEATRIESPNAYTFGGRDRQGEAEDRSRTVRDKRFRYIRHFFPDKPAMVHTAYPDHFATWDAYRRLASAEAMQRARGVRPSALTDVQRSVVAQSKPAEELYDIVADPHETTNLAGDPRFGDELGRLREALDTWLRTYEDLGAIPEVVLEERWRPNGVSRVTSVPRITVSENGISASCTTDGASLAWTNDPPAALPPRSLSDLGIGAPLQDGRRWHVYTTTLREQGEVWIKASRIGFEPSEEVHLPASGSPSPIDVHGAL